MHKGLKVLFWNVRSLYNKFDSISHEIKKMEPDILNISESWLQVNLPDHLVNIPNYSLIRNDRTTTSPNGNIKRGGGLCTYIKQGINFDVKSEYALCTDNIELSVVLYNLPCTRKIYVLNVYKPPMGDLDIFFELLQNCVNIVRNTNKVDIFIGGDFNIDVKNHSTPEFSRISRFLKINQLKQYIKQITRPDSNSTIDLLLSNCDIIKESGTIDINISDHIPIYFIRKKSKITKENVTFTGRSYRRMDKDTLSDRLSSFEWHNFANNDIDTCWNIMSERMNCVVNELCPIKNFKFARERPKWMTDDLIELMKNRDIALKNYIKTKKDEDKIEMRRMDLWLT